MSPNEATHSITRNEFRLYRNTPAETLNGLGPQEFESLEIRKNKIKKSKIKKEKKILIKTDKKINRKD